MPPFCLSSCLHFEAIIILSGTWGARKIKKLHLIHEHFVLLIFERNPSICISCLNHFRKRKTMKFMAWIKQGVFDGCAFIPCFYEATLLTLQQQHQKTEITKHQNKTKTLQLRNNIEHRKRENSHPLVSNVIVGSIKNKWEKTGHINFISTDAQTTPQPLHYTLFNKQ